MMQQPDTVADVVTERVPERVPERVVDRLYVLHERLGEGGMGTVYRATQRLSGQDVALKLIYGDSVTHDADTFKPDGRPTTNPAVETSEGIQLRLALEREFEVLASLHHPHIVRVLEYGFDKLRGPYLVMELLPAARSLVEAGSEASYATKIDWLGQLLRALAYLHRRGVIHRDIKPANVLYVDGQVKVVDFGIALHGTGDWGMAGTLEYMAPELMLGVAPCVASDLYSVGVLAFQLFTGRLPRQSASKVTALLDEVLDTNAEQTVSAEAAIFLEGRGGSPSNPGVGLDLSLLSELDAPLQAVLVRLLAYHPADRYADALTVLRELGSATGLPLVQETAETRESFLQAASLVGRDRELATLTNAFRRARSGHGGVWLLGGESGVGKSRLVDELRTLALVRGARVLRGQTVREGGGPFHVLRPILERICLEVPLDNHDLSVLHPILPRLAGLLQRSITVLPAVDSQSMQERVLVTLLKVFDAASGDPSHPLVVLLEDLHWAGRESMQVLARLGGLARQRSILVLGTYRDDDAPNLPAVVPSAEVLKLQRLDNASTAALCESMLGESGRSAALIEFLHRESEGNPFFIVEVMRALADEAGNLSAVAQQRLPDQILTGGVRAVLDRRISHVPQWAHPLLELAAVAGRQLDLQMLSHSACAAELTSHSLDGWLMHCADMSLLELRDQQWRFTHHKLRECVLERLQAAGRLARLHHEAARAIESAYPAPRRDEHIVKLAYHYLEAGPLFPAEQLYDAALPAAACQMQQLSFAEAASLLERVQAVTESAALGALRRYELFLALGQAHIRAGNRDLGKQACARAAELARQLGDPVLLARAAVTQGAEFSPSGTDPSLVVLLEEALRGLSASDHPLRARALARLAACLQPAPEPELPVAMAREAVAMARRIGDPEVLRQTLISACSALVTFGPLEERIELDRESVQLAARAHDRVQAQRGHMRLVYDYAELGDIASMDASILAYEEGAREFRQPQYQWPTLMLRAMRALMEGRFADSDQLTAEVQKMGERHQDFNAVFTAKLHRMSRFYMGELPAELLAVESAIRPVLTRIFAQQSHVYQAMTVWAQARAGLTAQARELVGQLRESRAFLRSTMYLPLAAEACYCTADAGFAEQLYERLWPLRASFWPVHYPVSMAFFPPYSQPLGLLAMTLHRWSEAVELLQHALARSESIGLRSHLSRLRYEYALALLGRGEAGDGAAARGLLRQARGLAQELGQVGLLALIDAQDDLAAARGFERPAPE